MRRSASSPKIPSTAPNCPLRHVPMSTSGYQNTTGRRRSVPMSQATGCTT